MNTQKILIKRILQEQIETEELICPFCKEVGFDKKGLKYHLLTYCEIFKNVESI